MLQTLYNLRHWFSWLVLLAAALAIVYWGFVESAAPRTVRVSVEAGHSWHEHFGEALKRNVERTTDYRVQLLRHDAPDDGRALVLEGDADVAVFQPGTVMMSNLAAIAPLWPEYVQILVRPGAGIETVRDLAGRNVALGPEDSGNRMVATEVLSYYGIDPAGLGRSGESIDVLAEDPEMEAAVVARALRDQAVRARVAAGDLALLALPRVGGLVFNHRHFHAGAIPPGVFPTPELPVPAEALPTARLTAVLAGRPDLPAATVETLLRVIESPQMAAEVPDLVQTDPREDPSWLLVPRHAAALSYFAGSDRFGTPETTWRWIVESLEWLVLLALVLGLAGYQWQRQRRQGREYHTSGVRREIERLFQELFRIEESQREARDVRVLQRYLNEVGQIKSQALKTALGTPVAESGLFQAFVQQARAVSQQIEWRIGIAGMAAAPEPRRRGASSDTGVAS
jgi:TRAP-type uncharacterized transport system substrate-binding protein